MHTLLTPIVNRVRVVLPFDVQIEWVREECTLYLLTGRWDLEAGEAIARAVILGDFLSLLKYGSLKGSLAAEWSRHWFGGWADG